MMATDPEWEYFWSVLIVETKELAQEGVKMSQTVAAFKKAMHRSFTAGRKAGQVEQQKKDEGVKSAAKDFADFRRPLSPEDLAQAKQVLGGLGDLFGFTPGKSDK